MDTNYLNNYLYESKGIWPLRKIYGREMTDFQAKGFEAKELSMRELIEE